MSQQNGALGLVEAGIMVVTMSGTSSFTTVCLSVSRSVGVFVYLSVSQSVFCVSMCLHACRCLSMCVHVCPCVFVCLSVCLTAAATEAEAAATVALSLNANGMLIFGNDPKVVGGSSVARDSDVTAR